MSVESSTGTAAIMPQNAIDIVFENEAGLEIEGYQIMDAEISGQYEISIQPGQTQTVYKRFAYNESEDVYKRQGVADAMLAADRTAHIARCGVERVHDRGDGALPGRVLHPVPANIDVQVAVPGMALSLIHIYGSGTDPNRAVSFFFSTTGNANVWGYSNERVDELCQLAVSTTDEAEREAYYMDAQQIIIEESPNLFFASPMEYLFASSALRGYEPYAADASIFTEAYCVR